MAQKITSLTGTATEPNVAVPESPQGSTTPTDSLKKALQKLEDQLTCAICLDPFKDPKHLHCAHIFCKDCLKDLVVQSRRGRPSICCPNCRYYTYLPAAGVSGLRSAFHVHHLQEIQEDFENVQEPQESPKSDSNYCSLHKEKELELYCETCGELICVHCTVKHHRGHEYGLIGDVFEKHKSEITTSLEPVETQLGTVNKALQQLDTRREQITDQRAAIEAEIHNFVQRLHEALDMRRTELISTVDHMTQQKLKNLAAQRDGIEMIQTQLNSCLEFVRESLRTGSQREIVNMKKPILEQIKEMTTNFNPNTLDPTEIANMKFEASSELSQIYHQFGKVYLQEPFLAKCHATGQGLEEAIPGERTTVTLHYPQEPDESNSIENVCCELVSVATAEKMKCTVTRSSDKSQFEISYKPTTRGRHQLNIKVKGEHIKGSPFTVMVKLPAEKLGTPIKTIFGLKAPWGLVVNKRREVIVAENNGHRVSIFSPSGDRVRSFGSQGSRLGQLKYPCGVAVDDGGDILVVDGGNHRIQKFTSNGNSIHSVGRHGNKPLEFNDPYGIAVQPHNKKVYVADRRNHRIQILNPDLTFSNSFGSRGSRSGQFLFPWDVAFDKTGNVYVTDNDNNRVQVFTAEGQFVRKFGRKGRGFGELNWPTSVAVDSDNVVYVAEWSNHRVSAFTCEGWFLQLFGTEGSGPGQFGSPRGVAIDGSGNLYVSDFGTKRVQMF